jgi:RNA polymerase sigma factor (sigma-70 family)
MTGMDQALKQNEALEHAWDKTRRSLIERLGNWEDQKTWDEFYQTYWRLIYAFASKAGLRDDECWEVVQETIVGIAKQSQRKLYDPNKGSFKSWLLTMARWRIGDQFKHRNKLPQDRRRRTSDEGDSPQTDTMERIPDPDGVPLEAVWDAEWNEHILSIALKNVREQISPKQYQIFDGYVIKGWDTSRVAEELGVSTANIYVTKHRVGRLVRKEITRLEEESS